MHDNQFLRSRLGHAALACTAAMVAFVALSAQIAATSPVAAVAFIHAGPLA